MSGLIIISAAHENARSTCGSSAALPFGRQTSTRGAAADGGAAAGSPTSGTAGRAAPPPANSAPRSQSRSSPGWPPPPSSLRQILDQSAVEAADRLGDDVERLVDRAVGCRATKSRARGENAPPVMNTILRAISGASVASHLAPGPSRSSRSSSDRRTRGPRRRARRASSRAVSPSADHGDPVARRPELQRQRAAHHRVVFDDDDVAAPRRGRRQRDAARGVAAASGARGQRDAEHRAPPGRSRPSTSPERPRTMLRQTNSPSPVPGRSPWWRRRARRSARGPPPARPGPSRHLDEHAAGARAPVRDVTSFSAAPSDGERLQGVDHQVQHHLDQAPFVAADRRRLVQIQDQPRARLDLLGHQPQHGENDARADRPAPRLLSSGRLKVRRSRVMPAMRAGARADRRQRLPHALQGCLRGAARRPSSRPSSASSASSSRPHPRRVRGRT